jgi:hypothetical protein
MTINNFRLCRRLFVTALLGLSFVTSFATSIAAAEPESAPAGTYERTYRQSKAAVERALKELQSAISGRLPVVEGFAVQGDRPLSRYQRAYYQSEVKVSATASGGSLVRVSTKVTAWYADSIPSHSGYQLLASNGRLESDLLDQLGEMLAMRPGTTRPGGSSGEGSNNGSNESFPAAASSSSSSMTSSSAVGSEKPAAGKETSKSSSSDSDVSAPQPKSVETGRAFSSSPEPPLSAQQMAGSKYSQKPLDQAATGLQAEAASLEEVLKNQAHPKNLVAVKKSGTPVVAAPSLSGKALFMASAHDEFEMLDYNADWVHVRVSGLSRGWIWRTSLEMPEGISDVPSNASAAPAAADLFQVTREETAPFPGDWEPLRGKNVKIISVQKIQENEKDSGAQAKLEFAKSLIEKNYTELAAKSQELFGIVLIFDSVDGGMIAATLPTVQQWKAGALTDAALWHQCYFDPPETFSAASPAAGH